MSPSELFEALHPKVPVDTQSGEYTMIMNSLAILMGEGFVERVKRGKHRPVLPRRCR